MAPAQNHATCRDHAVNPLLARKPGIFFDPVDWNLRSAAENREHRAITQKIDGVIPPLAVGDHAAVQIQDAMEFEAIKRHPVWHGAHGGLTRRGARLAWVEILRNQAHDTPPGTSA